MTSPELFYTLAGIWIAVMGLRGVLVGTDDFRKILSANILGSGVFLTLVSMAGRSPEGPPDPVPQGMILTGIVVAVSSTALLLALLGRLRDLEDSEEENDA
jgi:multicomponent Na+:H+ antiporter subunit C